MKNNYWLIVLFTLFLVACYEDEGNYDYNEINEIQINGIADNKWYETIALVDTLMIDPEVIVSTAGFDTTHLSYSWKVIPAELSVEEEADTLDYIVSREKKLRLPIEFSVGDYHCFYIVHDNHTQMSWYKKFYMRVKSITSEGWMVLCEEQGNGRLDVIFNVTAEDDLIAYDVWASRDFKTGKPYKLLYNYNTSDAALILNCEKGSYCLDREDLHAGEENDIKWKFGVTPNRFDVRGSGMSQFGVASNYWIVVDEKGDAYAQRLREVGSMFEYPINKLGGEIPFKAAPFIGVSYNKTNSYRSSIVMYDETNKQFVEILDGATYPSVMKFSGKKLFDAKTDKELIHMESTKFGMIYAILKDPKDNKFYFCAFEVNGDKPYIQKYYSVINGKGLNNATHFAFHNLTADLYYAVDNKIYNIYLPFAFALEAEQMLELPDETISVIRFAPFVAWEKYYTWEHNRAYQLVVGSNQNGKQDHECGVVRMFDLQKNPANFTKPYRSYFKMGRIVDINYKERSNK